MQSVGQSVSPFFLCFRERSRDTCVGIDAQCVATYTKLQPFRKNFPRFLGSYPPFPPCFRLSGFAFAFAFDFQFCQLPILAITDPRQFPTCSRIPSASAFRVRICPASSDVL